jgi:hypothetical protein
MSTPFSSRNAYTAMDDDIPSVEDDFRAREQGVNPTLLLELFGQTPIVFHRLYIDVTGSVTAALWLAYAIYHISEQGADREGWFVKSQQEWLLETGLSRREQETARTRLRALNLLEERRAPNAPLAYRIVLPQLHAAMEAHAQRLHAERQAMRAATGKSLTR